MVDAGSTFWSASPTIKSSGPRRFFAWVTFDCSAYHGPTGQPIHCSFRQPLLRVRRRKRVRYVRILRSRVNVLDHGVFLVLVEIGRAIEHAIDLGLSVAPLGDERLGESMIRRHHLARIRLLQLADELP